MRIILIWPKDTKNYVESGNKDIGSDLTIYPPVGQNPPEVVWKERDFDGYIWRSEFECDVKDKVWAEQWKTEKDHSRFYIKKYAHEDVLKRGFEPDELKFLNAYRDRFLLIGIMGSTTIEGMQDLYIWDNQTKEKYLMEYTHPANFDSFKKKLEELKLV